MTNEEAITTLSFLRSEYNCFDEGRERYHALSMGIEALKQNHWISVSERLPEKNGNYLIYVQSTQSELWYMRVDHYNSDSHFWTETSERPHRRVLAWMSLPSAYKGGEE